MAKERPQLTVPTLRIYHVGVKTNRTPDDLTIVAVVDKEWRDTKDEAFATFSDTREPEGGRDQP